MNKNKGFIKLITGQTIANIGDTIYIVVIIMSVFSWTNSVFATSLIPVLVTGGTVVAGFISPVITSRFRLEQVLKISQFCKTLLLFFMTFYLYLRGSTMNLLVLYSLVVMISCVDGCSEPISRALIPIYVKKEKLIQANGIFNSTLQIVSIGSWMLGTSLLIFFSIYQLILFDTFLFFLASLILVSLPKTKRNDYKNRSIWVELFNGWYFIVKEPLVRMIVGMDILESIANTAWLSAIVLVFVREAMNVSDSWWGYINATYFAGALIGSFCVIRFSLKFEKNEASAVIIGSIWGGLATIAVILVKNNLFILFLSVSIGIFSQIKNIPQASLLQQRIPSERLMPIYAASGILNSGAFALAALFMGQIADIFDVKIVFVCSGILLIIVGMLAIRNQELISNEEPC